MAMVLTEHLVLHFEETLESIVKLMIEMQSLIGSLQMVPKWELQIEIFEKDTFLMALQYFRLLPTEESVTVMVEYILVLQTVPMA